MTRSTRRAVALAHAVAIIGLASASQALAQRQTAEQAMGSVAAEFNKPFIFWILDLLIVSSPLTGLLAIVYLIDPMWRERPRGWWRRGRYEDIIRVTLLRKLVALAICGTLCMGGVLTFIFYMLGIIR